MKLAFLRLDHLISNLFSDRTIAVWINESEVCAVNGKLKIARLPKPYFEPSGVLNTIHYIEPDFNKPYITDYGLSIGFGGYEVSHDHFFPGRNY